MRTVKIKIEDTREKDFAIGYETEIIVDGDEDARERGAEAFSFLYQFIGGANSVTPDA